MFNGIFSIANLQRQFEKICKIHVFLMRRLSQFSNHPITWVIWLNFREFIGFNQGSNYHQDPSFAVSLCFATDSSLEIKNWTLELSDVPFLPVLCFLSISRGPQADGVIFLLNRKILVKNRVVFESYIKWKRFRKIG